MCGNSHLWQEREYDLANSCIINVALEDEETDRGLPRWSSIKVNYHKMIPCGAAFISSSQTPCVLWGDFIKSDH